VPGTEDTEAAVVRVLRELTGGFVGRVEVVRAERWELQHAMPDGTPYYVSTGKAETFEFDDAAQLELFTWLSEAVDLDPWSNSVWPEDRLLDSLSQFGAITLTTWRPYDAGFKMGPDGFMVSPSGRLITFDSAFSLLNASAEALEGTPAIYAVDARQHWQSLVSLRLALRLAVSRTKGDDTWRSLIASGFGPFRAIDTAVELTQWRPPKPGDRELAKLQVWFLSHVYLDGLTVAPLPAGAQLRLAFRPKSAFQRAWVTLAATAGILDLPFEVNGLFRCDYPRCGRWFFHDQIAVKGENRFCSVRCGKSYHAAIATRRRRAAEKQRRLENA
jgi:hypothetical protein